MDDLTQRFRDAADIVYWNAFEIAERLSVLMGNERAIDKRTVERWLSGQPKNRVPESVVQWLEAVARVVDAHPAPRPPWRGKRARSRLADQRVREDMRRVGWLEQQVDEFTGCAYDDLGERNVPLEIVHWLRRVRRGIEAAKRRPPPLAQVKQEMRDLLAQWKDQQERERAAAGGEDATGNEPEAGPGT